jgi:uncharacterized protein YndB with AHSA1/START domain
MQEKYMKVRVETLVNAPIGPVWEKWTQPEHITKWNHANEDWHCPAATNELREGGSFSWRMEAKDGSSGFDYAGRYDKVVEHNEINYTLDDGRHVWLKFEDLGSKTQITEVFEVEDENTSEMQKQGWQAILDNFKSYVERGQLG